MQTEKHLPLAAAVLITVQFHFQFTLKLLFLFLSSTWSLEGNLQKPDLTSITAAGVVYSHLLCLLESVWCSLNLASATLGLTQR